MNLFFSQIFFAHNLSVFPDGEFLPGVEVGWLKWDQEGRRGAFSCTAARIGDGRKDSFVSFHSIGSGPSLLLREGGHNGG